MGAHQRPGKRGINLHGNLFEFNGGLVIFGLEDPPFLQDHLHDQLVCPSNCRCPDDSHGTRVGAGIIYVLQWVAGVIVHSPGCALGQKQIIQSGNSKGCRFGRVLSEGRGMDFLYPARKDRINGTAAPVEMDDLFPEMGYTISVNLRKRFHEIPYTIYYVHGTPFGRNQIPGTCANPAESYKGFTCHEP